MTIDPRTKPVRSEDQKPYSRHVPDINDLPPTLAQLPIWCAWKLVKKPGKKPDKVPVSANPETLGNLSWSKPNFCTSAEIALAYAHSKKDLHGIGIILRDGCGLAGGDLDNCIDPQTGEVSTQMQKVIEAADTYTEISPGLQGFRFIAQGSFGGYTGNDSGGSGVEFYESGRFLTITGRHWPGTPADICQRDLGKLGQSFFGRSIETAPSKPESNKGGYTLAEVLPYLRNNSADYDEWQKVGAAIKTAGGQYGDWLAYSSQCPGKHDESDMPRKWASFTDKTNGAGMGTLARMAIENGMPRRSDTSTVNAIRTLTADADGVMNWPDLIDPFAQHPVPSFPLDILPVAFRSYCTEKAGQSGFDVGGYGYCLLLAAANTIDHRHKLNIGPFRVPAFHWGGLVADSGGGKSPVINATTERAEKINDDLVRESKQALSRWLNTQKTAQKKGEEPPPRPEWKQRHALDTTTEALALLLADNPEGVNMFHHEITEFLGRMDAYAGRDGGKDRGVYLRAYDGGQITINRATKAPLVVDDFSVGILAGIQPEVLAQKFKQSGAGADGLYQRFSMYCLAPAGQVNYMAMHNAATTDQVQSIFDTLHGWHRTSGKPWVIEMAQAAKQEMQDYHNHVRTLAQRTAAKRFAEHLDKFPGMLGRFAFALHVIDAAANGTDPQAYLKLETMQKARRLMGVLYRHSESVYRILDQEAGQVRALVASAAEAILSKGWDIFNRGDLTRNATNWQGSDPREAESAIDSMIELGWIMDVTPPTEPGKRGRRSAGRFIVNPEVHDRFSEHARRIRDARSERHLAIKKVAQGN